MTSPFQVVKDFERALCEYTGAPYAVTTTSCTMALLLAVAYRIQEPYGIALGGQVCPEIEIPKRTYVGVPYAIAEAGGRPVFRDEDWRGMYQLKPLPIFDSARLFTGGMFNGATVLEHEGGPVRGILRAQPGAMVCVSFHWSKTLGIQQGGAILHNDPQADTWLRRARFDGRTEGVPPAMDTFSLRRAWHAYMSPETAAAGLVRLAQLPKTNSPLPNDNYSDLSQIEAFR